MSGFIVSLKINKTLGKDKTSIINFSGHKSKRRRPYSTTDVGRRNNRDITSNKSDFMILKQAEEE